MQTTTTTTKINQHRSGSCFCLLFASSLSAPSLLHLCIIGQRILDVMDSLISALIVVVVVVIPLSPSIAYIHRAAAVMRLMLRLPFTHTHTNNISLQFGRIPSMHFSCQSMALHFDCAALPTTFAHSEQKNKSALNKIRELAMAVFMMRKDVLPNW